MRSNLGAPLVAWKPGLLRRMDECHWLSGFEALAFALCTASLMAAAVVWDLVAMAGRAILPGVRLRSPKGE